MLLLVCLTEGTFAQKKKKREKEGRKKFEAALEKDSLKKPMDSVTTIRLKMSKQRFWDSLPDPVGLTTDFERIFTEEQDKKLDSIMAEFEKKTTIQIAITTFDTANVNLDKFDELPPYIIKMWGIGREDKHNGISICISVGYRLIRIYPDDGLSMYVDQVEIDKIIQKKMYPQFKKEKYFEGTRDGLIALIDLIDSRINPPKSKKG
jgi:uncharacterized protein